MSTMAPKYDTYQAVLPATAAAADFEVVVCTAPYAGTVSSANFIPDTAITGANTDSRTIQLINKGQAGLGSTVVASRAFLSGTNGVAFDAGALTLSATAADLVLVAGDVLVAKSLHVGSTGLADPGGTLEVVVSRT